jgi:CspA family cold shock protein
VIHSVEAGSAPGQHGGRPTAGPRYPHRSISDYDDYGYGSKPSSGGVVEGIVKWFNPEKGIGFIAPDQGGKTACSHGAIPWSFCTTLRVFETPSRRSVLAFG